MNALDEVLDQGEPSKPRKRRSVFGRLHWYSRVLAIAFGLGLITWPVGILIVILMVDTDPASPAMLWIRRGLVSSILSYPVVYFGALHLSVYLTEKGRNKWVPMTPWVFTGVAAAVCFSLFSALP